MSDNEWKDVVAWLQRKPSAEEVIANIKRLGNGGKQMTEVTNYYFKDLMQRVRNGQDAFTIADSFVYKDIIEYFAAKIDVNDKVFPKKYPLGQLIESAMRLCGVRCCRKPSQFPLKTCHAILDEYLPDGGNWYDPCMGWGARMTAAWQRKNVTYYGTDTNKELYNRLCELAQKLNDSHEFLFDIRQFSATELQQGWIGKMDLCFTSPPYFNLEYYEGENTCCTEETTYEQWKDEFLKPVFNNCYAYLKDSGVMAWNIKDVYTNKTWWPLVKDSIICAEAAGFVFEDTRTLKNIKRPFGVRGWYREAKEGMNPNSDEQILIFRKA